MSELYCIQECIQTKLRGPDLIIRYVALVMPHPIPTRHHLRLQTIDRANVQVCLSSRYNKNNNNAYTFVYII